MVSAFAVLGLLHAGAVDLSQPFEESALYNANQAYLSLKSGARRGVRGFAILKNGKLAAEWYRRDISAETLTTGWSVTKSV
eukprot:CAMPEP_0119341364 /NCGR_PEP_ID=MMETSP1333-20130426/102180_1 /TAXON_ID=418940 /ORGANISM="Scyphosphaera apsteinii, Strain RCC1455" /LENGTH=80 /DNA_ID=CAMNT_0007353305 /DNA_START=67 /DNA_END=305 /DNA_ORIENTATION=-